jgi:hypothetical protein
MRLRCVRALREHKDKTRVEVLLGTVGVCKVRQDTTRTHQISKFEPHIQLKQAFQKKPN